MTIYIELPRYEAEKLKKEDKLNLLYLIEEVYVDTAHLSEECPPILFDLNLNTEPMFPAIKITNFADGTFSRKTINAVCFWNYMGDGTHCSNFIYPPFNLHEGDIVTIENKYNVKPFPAIVTSIEINRILPTKQWAWSISFKNITSPSDL